MAVVSTAAWVARDLADAGSIPVLPQLGLDLPELDGSTALWCSGAFALRLMRSDINHPFLAAGPHWLPGLPQEFLGRVVSTHTLAEAAALPEAQAFFKLSEHKHAGIPAAVYPSGAAFTERVATAFPGQDVTALTVTVSEPVRYRREFRAFIAHGQVRAASFYLSSVPGAVGTDVQITWDAFADAAGAPPVGPATVFAQRVVDALGTRQPPGYTLDVGEDGTGRFSVIEANAAWSSNIYHADPAGVIESVLASQSSGYPQWTWVPDALFLSRSRALPPR